MWWFPVVDIKAVTESSLNWQFFQSFLIHYQIFLEGKQPKLTMVVVALNLTIPFSVLSSHSVSPFGIILLKGLYLFVGTCASHFRMPAFESIGSSLSSVPDSNFLLMCTLGGSR